VNLAIKQLPFVYSHVTAFVLSFTVVFIGSFIILPTLNLKLLLTELHTSISASENAEREQKNRICRTIISCEFGDKAITFCL
jgi:hypothetical protein